MQHIKLANFQPKTRAKCYWNRKYGKILFILQAHMLP